jgi:hypothetical protein
LADGARGSADLVVYFFLRAYELLRDPGNFGLLAVNTITEGDTRQVGLERLVAAGAIIYAAYPSEPWPGKAAVVTSRIHIRRGAWQGQRRISGRSGQYISPFLSDREEWTPKRLETNKGIAFQGSIVLGLGFVVTEEDAQAMIGRDPRNNEVLFPYLNGEDLNSDPEQKASRWIINFWDWPEEKAKTYSQPYEIVRQKVKIERMRQNDRGGREKWWRFLRPRPELYHAIGRGRFFVSHPANWIDTGIDQSTAIVCSRHSKHLAYAIRPNAEVFSEALAVFARSDWSWFGFLSSSINELWARRYSGSLETRLRYAPSDAFETLPLPALLIDSASPGLHDHGRALGELRQSIQTTERMSMTQFYNRLHDPRAREASFIGAREALVALDRAVIGCYGFNIDLEYDFHEVAHLPENDRMRFTPSPNACQLILRRLVELNRERYQQEVQDGLA